MTDLTGQLGNHPVFACLPEGERAEFARQARSRDFPPGSTLADQGQVWPFLFLVERGEIAAVKVSAEGRSLVVTLFQAGDVFWGPAFFLAEAPLVATLEVRKPALVHLWERSAVEPLFLRQGAISWRLCGLMIERMQRASAIVEELAFQPVAGRLANLLLSHFDHQGETAVARSLTLDEMAARIGSTREMVCRLLYRFAGEKLIDVTRTEFVLTDREGLAAIISGS